MISASNAVVWVNNETKEILVAPHATDPGQFWGRPERHGYKGHWSDPIGAAYTKWLELDDQQRVQLMLETAIDLAIAGFAMADVLRAFAQVREFRTLGRDSYPMCRALTGALVGKRLEFNTMSFDELLETRTEVKRAGAPPLA
jgi:hypothetical protein